MLMKRLVSLAWGVRAGQALARRATCPATTARLLMRLRHVRRAQAGLRRPDARSHEYGFLVGVLIDTATLRRAEFFARRWQVSVHEVLIAQGWVSEPDYVDALADYLKMTTVAGKTLRAAFPPMYSPMAQGRQRHA